MVKQAQATSINPQSFILDPILWNNLQHSDSEPLFCQSWIQLQCSMIQGIFRAVVLWQVPEKAHLSPIAFYPDNQGNYEHYKKITETVIREKKGVVIREKDEKESAEKFHFQLGYPVQVEDKLYGVVVLEVSIQEKLSLQANMRKLQWGVGWLENYVRKTSLKQYSDSDKYLKISLDLTALVLQQDSFRNASTITANELSNQFNCHRVSIGFLKNKRSKLVAISHSAFFQKQMNLVQLIESAMDESIDQLCPIWVPENEIEQNRVTHGHDELAKTENTGAICTVPMLNNNGDAYGAITFERTNADVFDAYTIEAFEFIVAVIGSILEEKRKNDRWIGAQIYHSIEAQVKKLIGAGHLVLKLSVLFLLALVIFFGFATGEYRVTAKTALEGEIQRAMVAPFNGYIEDAFARAGDVVEEGEVLCTLDDKDLRLERLDAISKREQFTRELRKAMAVNERAQVKILQQQIIQADVQSDLFTQQIDRAEMKSPFNGVVVAGDLSQMLGAPVDKGQVLYEIAPLKSYRVILEVDESDIRDLKKGQQGTLILTSIPRQKLRLIVEKITPIASAKEGHSFFIVEASLQDILDELRPGMEGYSKIYIDRRKLIWIWTHDMIQWVRLKLWYWMP
ncbi:MAG: HlyD family efflux transporter periplasmic adaptor subunit [Desulfobacteraceae bacterium]|nr:HlyD family efflux transporter periplasmic adaptor subunit [Desulfobacteraceae bacterium]MBC2755134.1 HlyD family efflux transporter periplasmic adaptor subunit [Desulfobacteraceae bacterium]